MTGSMSTGHDAYTATLLPNGKVLVAGGWSGVVYQGIATAELYGRVLVAGGFYSPAGTLADTELYDPTTGQWTWAGNLAVARYNHTATLLGDGTVLVAGGTSTNDITSSAEVFVASGPALHTSVSAGNLILTWPATNPVSFHLQTSIDLSSNSWANADNLLITTNGVSQTTIPVGQGTGFYRLKY